MGGNRMKRIIVAVMAAALLVGLAAGSSASSASSASSGSGSSSSAGSSATISILTISDLSGPTKVYGVLLPAAVNAAVAYFNSIGGIDGHHVTATNLNDNGD